MTVRGLLLALLLAARVAAAPHVTITTTASRDTITPLQTIDYTIVVRNDGDSAPNYLRVTNRIPASALLVATPPGWTFEDNRQVSWMGRIEPGTAKTFTLTFVTRRDSAGLTLSNMTEASYDGAYANAFHDLQIDAPPTKGGVTHAGFIVFGYLAFMLVALLVIRMRVKNRMAFKGWMLLFIATGFLLFFAAEFQRELRVRREFRETRCTVLDALAHDRTTAVRYDGTVSVARGLAKRGTIIPCWIDPRDAKEVVLTRDFGAQYVFAVIPMLAIALAVWLIRR